jgi:hypothetical protein
MFTGRQGCGLQLSQAFGMSELPTIGEANGQIPVLCASSLAACLPTSWFTRIATWGPYYDVGTKILWEGIPILHSKKLQKSGFGKRLLSNLGDDPSFNIEQLGNNR